MKVLSFGLTVKTLPKLHHNGSNEEPPALKISVTERFILENSADVKKSCVRFLGLIILSNLSSAGAKRYMCLFSYSLFSLQTGTQGHGHCTDVH